MNLLYELIFTLRAIKKKLGFSMLCVVVVALGYTVSIPLYSMVRNFAYAPLSFPGGENFVMVKQFDRQSNTELSAFSYDFFQLSAIKESASTFKSLGGYQDVGIAFNDGELTQQYFAVEITAEAFSITATNPILGRPIRASDESPGADPVLLLGHSAWQNYYGASEDVIGRVARVNGVPHTIIGVMPDGFRYPLAAEMWLPLSLPAAIEPGAGTRFVPIGVLNDGVSRIEASAELTAILQRLGNDFPEHYADRSAELIPFTHGAFSLGFTLFNSLAGLAISIFVLISLNVGNLLTIRANERINELAIRAAMGASRVRLMFHVLLESLLVCMVGAVLGSVSAGMVLGVIDSFFYGLLPNGRAIPFWFDFSYSADVLIAASLMLAFLWLLSGSFAAWRATRQEISLTLASDSKGMPAKASNRLIRGLVNIQVILSFFLLVLSGVFVLQLQSFYESSAVDEPERFFTATIELSTVTYESETQRQNYRQELKELLLADGNIEEASFVTSLPGQGSGFFNVTLEEDEITDQIDLPEQRISWVDVNYFQTVGGLRLSEGRYFDASDSDSGEAVVIVDDVFIQQMQIEESPLGRRVRIIAEGEQMAEVARIVGVVPRYAGESELNEDISSLIYRPMTQSSPKRFQLLVKTPANMSLSVSELEEKIRTYSTAVDRDISLDLFDSLAGQVERNFALGRLVAGVLTGTALGALLLAVIGVYGLISRSVFVRLSEIGIRRALGSPDSLITGMFLRNGFFYIAMGIIFGGGVAALAINALSNSSPSLNLFPSLTVAFTVVTAVVGSLIVIASYVPVRGVVAMEPGEALHYE